MGKHVEASDAERRSRPYARANVAPVTESREPPQDVRGAPPAVTSRSQVIPRTALRLATAWRRKLRRCLQLADRGQTSQARRMRPADLWIPHEPSPETEATAAWDWDLRPIDRGEEAVPMRVSGRGGREPASGLNRGQVRSAAEDFTDRAIVSEMLNGIEDDSRCPRGTLLCAPHVSAIEFYSIASKKIAENEVAGWAQPASEWPCWPMRTAPYSVVDESQRAGRPKFRLATDMSWPQPGMMQDEKGEWVLSVNDSMDRSGWPANPLLEVTQYAEAAAVLKGPKLSPRRAKLWALDCRAFYRTLGRQTAELGRNGVWTEGGVQLDERCCFGDASAATKCARVTNLVVHETRRRLRDFDAGHPTRDPVWQAFQAERREAAWEAGVFDERRVHDEYTALHWTGAYIDDELGASADDLLFDESGAKLIDEQGAQRRRADLHFEIARDALSDLGWSSAVDKEVEPCARLDGLGLDVNLEEGRLRLSEAKRERYSEHADRAAGAQTCELADFEKLIGRLQFAVTCYPIGGQHMHAMRRALRARYGLAAGRVKVSKAVAADLAWWSTTMRCAEHEGVPLMCTAVDPDDDWSVVYADASGEGGFAAWTCRRGVVYMVADTWREPEGNLIICEKELLASTWGVVALEEQLGRRVLSYTDNTVAQATMRSLSSRSDRMAAITARRTHYLFDRGTVEAVRRVTSEANLWADIGSRPEKGGWMEVERQAAAMGLGFARVELSEAWRDTSALLTCSPCW